MEPQQQVHLKHLLESSLPNINAGLHNKNNKPPGRVLSWSRSQYWKLLLVWMSSRICCSSSSSKRPSKLSTG